MIWISSRTCTLTCILSMIGTIQLKSPRRHSNKHKVQPYDCRAPRGVYLETKCRSGKSQTCIKDDMLGMIWRENGPCSEERPFLRRGQDYSIPVCTGPNCIDNPKKDIGFQKKSDEQTKKNDLKSLRKFKEKHLTKSTPCWACYGIMFASGTACVETIEIPVVWVACVAAATEAAGCNMSTCVCPWVCEHFSKMLCDACNTAIG